MELIISTFSALFRYGASLPWFAIYKVLRVVFIVLEIVLLVFFFIILKKAWRFRPKFSTPEGRPKLKDSVTFAGDTYRREWAGILERAEGASPDTLRLAVIAADGLVDTILKDLEIEGEHMADRLEKLDAHQFASLDNLWRAHRARNQLVHEPSFELHEADARRYLKYYEDFIKEVGVL